MPVDKSKMPASAVKWILPPSLLFNVKDLISVMDRPSTLVIYPSTVPRVDEQLTKNTIKNEKATKLRAIP